MPISKLPNFKEKCLPQDCLRQGKIPKSAYLKYFQTQLKSAYIQILHCSRLPSSRIYCTYIFKFVFGSATYYIMFSHILLIIWTSPSAVVNCKCREKFQHTALWGWSLLSSLHYGRPETVQWLVSHHTIISAMNMQKNTVHCAGTALNFKYWGVIEIMHNQL